MSVLPIKGPSKSALQAEVERVSVDVFSQDLILDRFTSTSQRKPLVGVIICGTGFSREVRRQVQITTERLGGQYSRDLHLNCTHLLVHNCSGRKFQHAVNHGVHRGLHIVSTSWFEDCVKQNARLDESLYTVPSARLHQIGVIVDITSSEDVIGGATQTRNLPSVYYDMDQADVRLQSRKPPISPLKISEAIRFSLSPGMHRTPPPASPTVEDSTSLAGARFYIDPDLGRDFHLKAQESVETWGAMNVQNCSQATHVVCESKSISKYIGLNLHLVSPLWVMSARDGCPLRCVHYSADLARDVGSLLLESKGTMLHDTAAESKALTLQQREKIASLAKAGVRRRRGPQVQSSRIRPRPQTPASLLESTYWIVTDTPNSIAQVHTQREDQVVFAGSFLTILFPIDRFSELGPSSRTFFSDNGFTRWQIMQLVYTFYQEPLDAAEVNVAIHTDSKHGDRLRASVQLASSQRPVAVCVPRHHLLGARVQFQGLQRTHSVDPCSHIYNLCLATTTGTTGTTGNS